MKQKLFKIIIPVVLLILIIAGSCWFILRPENINLTFKEKDHTVIEYGTKTFDTADLIDKMVGKITEYPKVDTMKLGKQEINFEVKKNDKSKIFTYTVEVKDTQKPVIACKEETLKIALNSTFDPKANIKSVEDPVDGALALKDKAAVKEGDVAYYTITSNVNVKAVGTYQVIIDAMDKNKNIVQVTYGVEVGDSIAQKSDNKAGLGDKSNEAPTTPTYIKNILIVNKTYGLPKDFIGNGPNGADQTAYDALVKLQTGAIEAGYQIPKISGYRAYDYQVTLYNDYVKRDGKEAADRYSARPGFSEHQTGLCFDIGDIDNDYGKTPAGKWLDQHAHEYGYIIRYPDGKEAITGYMYEPWHVRYVGVEVATQIKKANMTLEEYLGVAK